MGASPFGHPPWIHWKQKFWALYFHIFGSDFYWVIFPPKSFWKIFMSHSFRPACVSWVKIEQIGFKFWFMKEICKFAFEKHLMHSSGKFELCRLMPVAGWDWPVDPAWFKTRPHLHTALTLLISIHSSHLSLLTALLPLAWMRKTGMENCVTWDFLGSVGSTSMTTL